MGFAAPAGLPFFARGWVVRISALAFSPDPEGDSCAVLLPPEPFLSPPGEPRFSQPPEVTFRTTFFLRATACLDIGRA